MTGERTTGAARRRRLWPHPILAGALGVLLLLLFCWPFVQVPRPTLPVAFLHVFVSWGAGLGLLWWISRGWRSPDAGSGDGDG